MARMLPDCIVNLIADYSAEVKMLPWIPCEKLDEYMLYNNPGAIDAGIVEVDMCCDVSWTNTHPAVVKEKIRTLEDDARIAPPFNAWKNPMLLDYLLEHDVHKNNFWWVYIASNPAERAVKMLLEKPEVIVRYRGEVSKNPSMMPYLREHPELITRASICANPAAIDIISARTDNEIEWSFLCENPHPWALEKLRANQDRICWDALADNPGIFAPQTNPAHVEVLRALTW